VIDMGEFMGTAQFYLAAGIGMLVIFGMVRLTANGKVQKKYAENIQKLLANEDVKNSLQGIQQATENRIKQVETLLQHFLIARDPIRSQSRCCFGFFWAGVTFLIAAAAYWALDRWNVKPGEMFLPLLPSVEIEWLGRIPFIIGWMGCIGGFLYFVKLFFGKTKI
jgi:hypothetical protein